MTFEMTQNVSGDIVYSSGFRFIHEYTSSRFMDKFTPEKSISSYLH